MHWLLLSGTLLSTADVSIIEVRANGFEHTRGHAIAKLFWPGESITGRGHVEQGAAIVGQGATFRFAGLAAGDYALVVFHDENDNGVIDHGWLGPSEALGFSGGFRLGPFSGMPTFDKLRFHVAAGVTRLEITVR